MKKAFTLVELLIVIAIIAIISVIIVVSFGNAQQKARDTKSKADLTAIASALEAYHSQKGIYPNSTPCTKDRYNNGIGFAKLDKDTPCATLNELVSLNYIAAFPKDPNTTKGYFYTTNNTSGKAFKVIKLDPELINSGMDETKCKSIAAEYADPVRACTAYRVTSNADQTKDW